ncbi:hypothetical protein FGO68_gene7386 [Halteria grandinella]|uniref:Uncharacterized protein n=1 Tax=Halteria grandinella TaxID=5974 RepID=A0A8J8SUA4_HALGN|nr:hypothetical protein FGO68_gene7386 [Halteria grandinella]
MQASMMKLQCYWLRLLERRQSLLRQKRCQRENLQRGGQNHSHQAHYLKTKKPISLSQLSTMQPIRKELKACRGISRSHVVLEINERLGRILAQYISWIYREQYINLTVYLVYVFEPVYIH